MISFCDAGSMRGSERMVSFKGVHCEKDIILTCVRWWPTRWAIASWKS
jgi:hypothetical protein